MDRGGLGLDGPGRPPHRPPSTGTRRGRDVPAAFRPGRVLRDARRPGVLPGGRDPVRGDRGGGESTRAAAAEPVRVLDLPGELTWAPSSEPTGTARPASTSPPSPGATTFTTSPN